MKHKILQWYVSLTLVLLSAYSTLAEKADADALTLRGQVRSVRQLPSDPSFVDLEVKLDLEFINTGERPIIFLQPQDDVSAEIFFLGVVSLAKSKALAEKGEFHSYIWSQAVYPSVVSAPEDKVIAMRLDQPSPPSAFTRILSPKASWAWRTGAFLRFYAKRMSSVFSAHDMPWEEIGKIDSPLWMRLTFEMWSRRLRGADKNLGGRLRRRWKRFGILNTRMEIATEPIELKLSDVKFKAFNNATPNNSFNRSANSVDFIENLAAPALCARPVNSGVRRQFPC